MCVRWVCVICVLGRRPEIFVCVFDNTLLGELSAVCVCGVRRSVLALACVKIELIFFDEWD